MPDSPTDSPDSSRANGGWARPLLAIGIVVTLASLTVLAIASAGNRADSSPEQHALLAGLAGLKLSSSETIGANGTVKGVNAELLRTHLTLKDVLAAQINLNMVATDLEHAQGSLFRVEARASDTRSASDFVSDARGAASYFAENDTTDVAVAVLKVKQESDAGLLPGGAADILKDVGAALKAVRQSSDQIADSKATVQPEPSSGDGIAELAAVIAAIAGVISAIVGARSLLLAARPVAATQPPPTPRSVRKTGTKAKP
jgi:hypothetical protein